MGCSSVELKTSIGVKRTCYSSHYRRNQDDNSLHTGGTSSISLISIETLDEEQNVYRERCFSDSAPRVNVVPLHDRVELMHDENAPTPKLYVVPLHDRVELVRHGEHCGAGRQEPTTNHLGRSVSDRPNGRTEADRPTESGNGGGGSYGPAPLSPSSILSAVVTKRILIRGPSLPSLTRKGSFPPVRRIIHDKSTQAKNLMRNFSEIYPFTTPRREIDDDNEPNEPLLLTDRPRLRQSRIVVVPPNHPLKILWNVLTVLLTFVSAYTTHTSIRDRRYESTAIALFLEAWFVIDILLNFITAHRRSDGTVASSGSAVWGRYLTTWFPIDALALVPWERMYLSPIIDRQNRRNLVTKLFFRSRATVKVTRMLKNHHFKIFGRVVNGTKKIGVGGRRLLTLLIKYIPKYLLFYRNMKVVLVLKLLRQIHFGRKVANNFTEVIMDEDGDSVDEIRVHGNVDHSWMDRHPKRVVEYVT